jgi:hypothetical protein
MSTCRAGHGCCGSDTGSPNTHFGSMVRLTMLHRVPPAALQEKLLSASPARRSTPASLRSAVASAGDRKIHRGLAVCRHTSADQLI